MAAEQSPLAHAETSSIVFLRERWNILAMAAHNPPYRQSSSRTRSLRSTVRIGGTLSVLGSIFFIVSYCLFRRSRTFSRRLLLYLTIADLMASVGWLLSGFEKILHAKHPGALCVIQGYLLQFFYLASFLWTSCFAWHLFQIDG